MTEFSVVHMKSEDVALDGGAGSDVAVYCSVRDDGGSGSGGGSGPVVPGGNGLFVPVSGESTFLVTFTYVEVYSGE